MPGPAWSIPTQGFAMIRAASNRSAPPSGSVKPANRPPLIPAFGDAWRELRKGLFDTYRPELHYMRGPGPKWHEKHGAPQTTRSGVIVRALRGATAWARTVPFATPWSLPSHSEHAATASVAVSSRSGLGGDMRRR